MMFLQWFIMGAWYVTVGNYMGAIGMSEHIYWAYTVVPISAIVSPYFLGLIADRYFATEKILAFLQIAGGIAIFCAPWAAEASWGSAFWFIFMLLIHALCFAPTIALTSSLAFHHLTNQEKQFPIIRVFGTIGWIAAGFLVSKVLEADTTKIPLQVAGGASVLMGFFCLTLPHTPPTRKGKAVSFRQIIDLDALRGLMDRPFIIFLISAFLIFIPMSGYYTYAPVFVNDLGLSNPGFRMSFGQMSEVFFMLIIPLLLSRLGVKWMIAGGMLAWSLRYSLFALSSVNAAPWMVMTAIILHGICFDFLYVVGQIYVDKKSSDSTRGQAQGLFVFVTTGLGQLVGAQATGLLFNSIVEDRRHHPESWQAYWSLLAIASGIIMLAFIIFFHDRAKASPGADHG
jgi:nucleoside transporter